LVADSRRALLLVRFGPGMLPTYCFPADDVRTDLLAPSGTAATNGELAHDVLVDGDRLTGVARLFVDPPGPLAALKDHWTFAWGTGLSWFEEATEVHVHARDPMKRVDVVPSERHVRIEIDGVVVAESTRPNAVFETHLPTRWYLPLEDVRTEFLEPSATITRCPYKGTASYWSARVNGVMRDDIAWTYQDPIPECAPVKGLGAFFNQRVELVIDGVRQERPRTPWSQPENSER
jgi:uncharacterized protein (DUF427 family)